MEMKTAVSEVDVLLLEDAVKKWAVLATEICYVSKQRSRIPVC